MALSFLLLKKGEEAVGIVISLMARAGVAMVTGIKDYNKQRKKELRIILYYLVTISVSCYAVMCTRFQISCSGHCGWE